MALKVCVLLVLVAAVAAEVGSHVSHGHGSHHAPSYHAPAPSYHAPAPSYHAPAPSYHKPTYEEKPHPYDFAYGVVDDYTGNDFGHQESSNGDGTVYGQYHVLLPDGRKQIVKYTVDHYNGYQAEVTYEGYAKYPEQKPHYSPAPSYHSPAPSYHAPAPSYHAPAPSYH